MWGRRRQTTGWLTSLRGKGVCKHTKRPLKKGAPQLSVLFQTDSRTLLPENTYHFTYHYDPVWTLGALVSSLLVMLGHINMVLQKKVMDNLSNPQGCYDCGGNAENIVLFEKWFIALKFPLGKQRSLAQIQFVLFHTSRWLRIAFRYLWT